MFDPLLLLIIAALLVFHVWERERRERRFDALRAQDREAAERTMDRLQARTLMEYRQAQEASAPLGLDTEPEVDLDWEEPSFTRMGQVRQKREEDE